MGQTRGLLANVTRASVLPKALHSFGYSTSHYKNKTLQIMGQTGRCQVVVGRPSVVLSPRQTLNNPTAST